MAINNSDVNASMASASLMKTTVDVGLLAARSSMATSIIFFRIFPGSTEPLVMSGLTHQLSTDIPFYFQ